MWWSGGLLGGGAWHAQPSVASRMQAPEPWGPVMLAAAGARLSLAALACTRMPGHAAAMRPPCNNHAAAMQLCATPM